MICIVTIFFFQVVPEGSIDLLSVLPGIKDLEVTAKYPIAEGVSQTLIIKNKYLTTKLYSSYFFQSTCRVNLVLTYSFLIFLFFIITL